MTSYIDSLLQGERLITAQEIAEAKAQRREKFALAALTAMSEPLFRRGYSKGEIAVWAWALADAMLQNEEN